METNLYDQAQKLAKEVSGSSSRYEAHLGMAPHMWIKRPCLPTLEWGLLLEELVLGQAATCLTLL